jgi:hypothetical protein
MSDDAIDNDNTSKPAPFGWAVSWSGLLVVSESMLILLFSFCRNLVTVVTSHRSGSEKWQAESLAIR